MGPATRLAEYLAGLDKEYFATVRLGTETETLDPEGEVVARSDGWRDLDRVAVEEAVRGFEGLQLQTPPAYSAKKVGGEAAHRRVRRGESVDLEPVEVTVHELEVTGLDLPEAPEVHLRVRCSSGTYVRALARDLGNALGVGGHLTALRRTAVGPYRVDGAASGDDLRPETVGPAWLTPAEAMAHLPSLRVSEEECRRLTHGQVLERGADGGLPEDTPVVLLRDDTLVAIGVREGERVRPRKVFVRG